MPLRKGSSRSTISENIRELHTGDTYAHTAGKFGKRRADKQAVAIALDVARKAKRTRRAEGGGVSFDDRWNGEPYRETADDLAARAHNSLATQADRLGPAPLPDVGPPLIGNGGQFSAGSPRINRAVDRAAEITAGLPRALAAGAIHDVQTPGALMKPNPYPEGSEEAAWYDAERDRAATQWGPSMALNTMGAGLHGAQPGSLGIFGGRLAKTADLSALERAEQMVAAGHPPERVWQDTGWFQGEDGKWRFEIDDGLSGYRRQVGRGTIDNYPISSPHTTDVGSAYQHPELYAAYPDLQQTDLAFHHAPESDARGYYRPPGEASPGDLIPPPAEQIGIKNPPDRYGKNMDQVRSTTLHELQHAVQEREGFAPGSSPEAMNPVVQAAADARLLRSLQGTPDPIGTFRREVGRDPHPHAQTLLDRLTPEELEGVTADPYDAYRRVAGEVEARNVQARRDMTAQERRGAFPPSTEDVPAHRQILRPPRRGGAASLDEVNSILTAERNLQGASSEPRAAAAAVPGEPAAAPGAGEVGPGGGGAPGAGGLPEAQATAARWAGARAPLEGLPGPLKIGQEHFVPGPIGKIHDVAEDYMRTHHPDRPYTPPTRYHPLDPEHSKAIAQAYEEMQHTPNDPATKASYDALIKETADQYQAIKKTGLKIEPIPPGMEDPYAANPRMAARDVAENNHLWFYPTEQGFGTVNKISDNPMLRKTGEKIGDHELLANDMFRVVHDYFGHLKEGHGFRAAGEDNAWRTHAQMYSDIARPAMTTETRGQNSWVNYGPHGEANRKASAADTIYADQKVGLLPEWTMRDRNSPAPIMVYHGTPHSFDRFDFSKIGSGEGNQAYGHGLYFAGHEPVSEWYRHQLATRQDPRLKKYGLEEVGHTIGSHLSDVGGDAAKLAQQYAEKREELLRNGPDDKATANMIDEYSRRIKYLQDPKRSKGQMYQVAMQVDPEHLLDYQAPFREQSGHVQERVNPMLTQSVAGQREAISRQLENNGPGVPGGRFFRPFTASKRAQLEGRLQELEQHGHNFFPGSEIYKRAGLPAKNEPEMAQQASRRLKELGIPGLHYPDAGSRAPGQKGSRNYVMFGDEPLRIHRKYAMGGAALDMARRMRKARADGGSVLDWGGVGEAMPEYIGRNSEPTDPIIRSAISAATLPKRAMESSRRMVETGEYDPAPILEAATLPMGTGAIGARALPGEAVFGSGPVRRIADDTGAALTIARRSKQYAEPEYAPSGSLIVNKGVENPPNPAIQTVADPYRMMYPGIYRNPRVIAEEAAARVGEEDPAMKRLFGVTRGDLREMAQGRVGNEEPVVPPAGGRSRGSLSAMNIQTPQNTQRLQDILAEAGRHEGLRTADAWYIMDPVYRRMVELHGPEAAPGVYRQFNTLTGMASPGSDVMTEIQRGTAANWLHNQGRFGDFMKYAGVPEEMRSPTRFPADLRYIGGHPYHRTAQAGPMEKYLERGSLQSEAPKVPLYVQASGVPETGFQTAGPVGDAHFSRGVGLSDTRKGPTDVQGSFSKPEYQTLQPWWRHEVAGPVGLESVPAQARLWTALGPQTGVESELGAPKLELLSKQIMAAAQRLRISPEKARDLILSGKAGAGLLAGGILAPGVMESMSDRRAAGGAVSRALEVARRARGGKVHTGAIIGHTDGRADEVPMQVPDGAYVLTADHVSSMGEGNTLAGFKKLDQMFPKSASARHAPRSVAKRAAGGAVPIYAADGEYVICPEDITDRWGDLDAGHRYLDAWQTSSRKEHVNTLRNLAPPAQD